MNKDVVYIYAVKKYSAISKDKIYLSSNIYALSLIYDKWMELYGIVLSEIIHTKNSIPYSFANMWKINIKWNISRHRE